MAPRRMEVKLATLGVIDADYDVLVPNLIGPDPVPATLLGAHEHRRVPIGRSLVKEVNGTELRATLDFNDSQPGQDWWRALSFDFAHEWPSVTEFSFGFTVGEDERGVLQGQRVRFIKSMTLYECSPCMKGASVDSRILSLEPGKARGGWEMKVQRFDPAQEVSPSLAAAVTARVKAILSREPGPDGSGAVAHKASIDPVLSALQRRIAQEEQERLLRERAVQADLQAMARRLARLGGAR